MVRRGIAGLVFLAALLRASAGVGGGVGLGCAVVASQAVLHAPLGSFTTTSGSDILIYGAAPPDARAVWVEYSVDEGGWKRLPLAVEAASQRHFGTIPGSETLGAQQVRYRIAAERVDSVLAVTPEFVIWLVPSNAPAFSDPDPEAGILVENFSRLRYFFDAGRAGNTVNGVSIANERFASPSAPNGSTAPGVNSKVNQIRGGKVNAPEGTFSNPHKGLDFHIHEGQPVYAVKGGTVVHARAPDTWVTVQHDVNGDGTPECVTLYEHVIPNPQLSEGSVINTGALIARSTAPTTCIFPSGMPHTWISPSSSSGRTWPIWMGATVRIWSACRFTP